MGPLVLTDTILVDVTIGGQNVTTSLLPVLEEITVFDGSDNEADSADIVMADIDGAMYLANARDPVSIQLGRPEIGAGLVFEGFCDEPRSKGGRDGRRIHLSCKSVDLEGAAKEAREDYWDDATLDKILSGAFEGTGISVQVDPAFAAIMRDYESMDGRDPLTFAADLAREVGATFKVMGNRGVFAQRNTGMSLIGEMLPTFVAAWGVNLLEWDITPVIPRSAYSEAVSRWFDFAKNEYKEERASISGKVPLLQTTQRATQAIAKELAEGDKTASERESGAGSILVRGSYLAQAGGKCSLVGARAAIDGTYIIQSVTHNATLNGGFTSRIALKHPEDGAGVDGR